ncbi:MAG: ribosomal protein S18-alanine N-acetyltransferase [Rhizobiaceae bacterium]
MVTGVLGRFFYWQRKSVIQPVTMDDLAALSEIHTACFSRGWSDGEFEALLAQGNYFCLVARKPGKVGKPPSAFVLAKTVLDEAEIISVAVKPSARRKGIARQLMDAAIRQLNSDRVKFLFLEVDMTNEVAIHLYRKMGFREIGNREAYYTDDQQHRNNRSAALVMRLELG